MSDRIYNNSHYQLFFKRLTDAQVQVFRVITENNNISKKDIIDKLNSVYSKNPIVNAIDALLFAGLITYKKTKRQHHYFLSLDGKAFTDFVTAKFEEE